MTETKSANWQREAIEKCIIERYDRLLYVAKNYDRRDPEELLGRTILHALNKSSSLKDDGNVYGWLSFMMRNLFINEYRRSKKRETLVEIGDWEDSIASKRSEIDDYDDNESFLSLSVRLANVLSYKYCVVLFLEGEGLRYREIAERLKIPLGTTMSRLYRGRIQARRLLLEETSMSMEYPATDSLAFKIVELAKQKIGDAKIAEELNCKVALVMSTKSFWRRKGVNIPYLKTPIKRKPAMQPESSGSNNPLPIPRSFDDKSGVEMKDISTPVELPLPMVSQKLNPDVVFRASIVDRIFKRIKRFSTDREMIMTDVAILKELVDIAEELEIA